MGEGNGPTFLFYGKEKEMSGERIKKLKRSENIIEFDINEFKNFIEKINVLLYYDLKKIHFNQEKGIIEEDIIGRPEGYYGTGLFFMGRETILKGKIKTSVNEVS